MGKQLTAERLRELLHYSPETGVFRWRVANSNRVRVGSVAGFASEKYITIRIDGHLHQAHRLAWLYMHGRWPVDQLDHRDGNKQRNAIGNLRECSNSENHQNMPAARKSASGLLGAFLHKRSGRWLSGIKLKGRMTWLGYFDTPEAAHATYLEAKAKLHTFNPVPTNTTTTKASNDEFQTPAQRQG